MNKLVHLLGISGKYVLLNLKALNKLLIKNNSYIDLSEINSLVFTHNLGGGTEQYVKSHFYHDNVLIVRLISYRNDFAYSIENKGKSYFLSSHNLEKLLINIKFEQIFVNSVNAYLKPNKIFILISKLKYKKLSYLVHDYHCICRTGLFIYNDKYCDRECDNCHLGSFMNEKWHSMWNIFFSRVDEVICFSNSSKDICLKYYPCLEKKIITIPHSMDYCKFKKMKFNGHNIGIVGNCSNVAKGKYLIKELIKYLEKSKKYKLIVIGKSPTLLKHQSQFYHCTGPYNIVDLPKLLEDNQVGITLFTTIIPETFSYTVSELIKLDMPIVSVNLGAQGEKIEKYEKGYFIDNYAPETIIRFMDNYFKNTNN